MSIRELGALDTTLETSNERMIALQSQMASKDGLSCFECGTSSRLKGTPCNHGRRVLANVSDYT